MEINYKAVLAAVRFHRFCRISRHNPFDPPPNWNLGWLETISRKDDFNEPHGMFSAKKDSVSRFPWNILGCQKKITGELYNPLFNA